MNGNFARGMLTQDSFFVLIGKKQFQNQVHGSKCIFWKRASQIRRFAQIGPETWEEINKCMNEWCDQEWYTKENTYFLSLYVYIYIYTVDGKNFASAKDTCLMRAGEFPRSTTPHPPHSPPAPPNLILQSGRFSLAKLFPGKGRIFRDNLELSILNWGVRGVTKQKKKIKAARFYLQSFFRPQ